MNITQAFATSLWPATGKQVRRLMYLFLMLIANHIAMAAGQTNDAPSESPLLFYNESRLVVLDVTVTDHNGNVKAGLNRNDFIVTENGVPQTIQDFEAADDRPPIPAVPMVDHAGHDSWGNAPLTMIVVDEMDTPFAEMAYARQCAEHYLKAQAAQLPEPTILLWLNDKGFHPLTRFTRNRDEVLGSLQKHPSALPGRLARGAVVDQLSAAFSALQQSALFSRGEPGKKEIIWIGRGFPAINGVNLGSSEADLLGKAVRSTLNLLLAARVSLYVIDPAIGKSEILGGAGPAQAQTPIGSTPLPAANMRDPFVGTFDMNFFVSQTGGKYYLGLNDLDRQIDESVQRGTRFYTLSYVPKITDQQFDYRRIQIRMRDPGLTARTKQGYYPEGAFGPGDGQQPTEQGDADLRFDVYEASVTGMEYTGLKVSIERCQRDSDAIHTICVVRVDTGSLTFARNEEGVERTSVLAVVSSLDAKGNVIFHTAQRISFHIPQSQENLIFTGSSRLTLKTMIPQSAKIVRMVLRDESGRIGTADVDQEAIRDLIGSARMHQ